MNKTLTAIATTVLLSSLMACGNEASPSQSPITSTVPLETPASSPPAAPSAAASIAPTATAPASPSASASASASAEVPDIAQEVKKTYRMNKAYRIVPIDKETTNSKVVLLTFDDGPKDEVTLKPMLDTLDKHKAKAIFFVNGYRVKAHPELLVEIDSRQQIIGNHSWDHIDLKKETPESASEQVVKVQSIVKELTGKTPEFFRPPFGSSNDSVRQIVKDNGLLFMTWSNGSLDWDLNKTPLEQRPQAVLNNVMEQLHEGSNILMHELPWTADILDELLTQLEAKGYSFVDPNAIDIEL